VSEETPRESIPFGTLPPVTYLRWSWSAASESWVCGESGNGAGVFYEDGSHPDSPEGYYYGTVVGGHITDVARGPYPTRAKARDEAGRRLRELRAQV